MAAASIWVTAALGVLCCLAAWKLLVVAVAGVLFLLLAGGPIEKWCQKALGIETADAPETRWVSAGVPRASFVWGLAA